MKILVTGSLGFIGSHLVDRLVALGHEVVGVDDFSGGDPKNANKEASTIMLDLRHPDPTKRMIDQFKPEIVYHLAANAAENKAQFSPIDISTRNYNTFLNVVVPAINNKVRRFIAASSIAVYGHGQTPFMEDTMPMPQDVYGISKLAMEQTLKVLSEVHEFEYMILRPHNVYGPRQNMTDPYRNVVTIFMNSLLKGEAYNIYGDGEQRRCFSYIDDVVDAFVEAGIGDYPLEYHTFNVGADKDYSLNELSEAIQKVADVALEPYHLPDRPQEVKIATADHTLAKEVLGYKDKTSLQEGIKRTWEWAKMQGPQEPKYTGFEIESEKIPSNWRKQ